MGEIEKLQACRFCGWKYECKGKRPDKKVMCDFFINYTLKTFEKSAALRKLFKLKDVKTVVALVKLLPIAPLNRRTKADRRATKPDRRTTKRR